MPGTTNGRSHPGAAQNTQPVRVLRLGDLTPERIQVDAGPGRMLQAWVCANQRYPASVAAELEDARNEYMNKRERVYQGPPPPELIEAAREASEDPSEENLEALRAAVKAYEETPRYRTRAVDWEAYLTRCLMILIPGLEAWEADLLLPEQRLGWLFDLGYFQRDQAAEEQEGEGQRPPEAATSSTGDKVVPDLAGSTT